MTNTTSHLIDWLRSFRDDPDAHPDLACAGDKLEQLTAYLVAERQLVSQLQQRNAELERERDELGQELNASKVLGERADKSNAKMIHLAQKECDEWKSKKFARFADDECWLFQDDGEDYLESLVCPVVMSKDKAIELVEAREKLDILSSKIMSRAMNRQDKNELDMLMRIIEQPPKTSLSEHDAAVTEPLRARIRELESQLSDLVPEFSCQCGHPSCSIERTRREILEALNKKETRP